MVWGRGGPGLEDDCGFTSYYPETLPIGASLGLRLLSALAAAGSSRAPALPPPRSRFPSEPCRKRGQALSGPLGVVPCSRASACSQSPRADLNPAVSPMRKLKPLMRSGAPAKQARRITWLKCSGGGAARGSRAPGRPPKPKRPLAPQASFPGAQQDSHTHLSG